MLRLSVSPTLARTLRSTNSIESMISIARNSADVKNWQSGNMALRWCAAGMIEASKQFRRVNGHLHLPARKLSVPCVMMNPWSPPNNHEDRHRNSTGSGTTSQRSQTAELLL